MSATVSQITSLTIVYSTVYSGTDQRKHQSSASLAFVQEIHRWPVYSPHKGPVTWKMFPFDDVIMIMRYKSYQHRESTAGTCLFSSCERKVSYILWYSYLIAVLRTINLHVPTWHHLLLWVHAANMASAGHDTGDVTTIPALLSRSTIPEGQWQNMPFHNKTGKSDPIVRCRSESETHLFTVD